MFLNSCGTLKALARSEAPDLIKPDIATCVVRVDSGGLLCVDGEGYRRFLVKFGDSDKYVCRTSQDQEKIEDWIAARAAH